MKKTKRWLALLFAALMVFAGCDRNSQQADENGAAEQGEEQAQQDQAQEGQAQQEQAGDEEQEQEAEPPPHTQAELPPVDELDPMLLDPSQADEQAPDSFQARFETTEGDFVIEFNREWGPNGVDRAYNLIKAGYYDGLAFFRVVEGFMAQFGIHGHPQVNEAWMEATAEPDERVKSNTRGMVSFAQRSNPRTRQSDPATRTTHLFINYTDNSALDQQQFVPVGEVVEGMDVVDSLHNGYGGGPPTGPNQKDAMEKGNEYLQENFPKLDYIKNVEIIDSGSEADSEADQTE